MVPTLLMILTYEVKQLMGISSMNQLEEHLLRCRKLSTLMQPSSHPDW